jgi:hypothetical protein
MFVKQLTRSTVAAVLITGVTASTGLARPEGAPPTPPQHAPRLVQDLRSPDAAAPPVAASLSPSAPARTEGMGVQPSRPAAATPPVTAVKAKVLKAAGDTGGLDWPSALLGASLMLALVAAVFAGRAAVRHGHGLHVPRA